MDLYYHHVVNFSNVVMFWSQPNGFAGNGCVVWKWKVLLEFPAGAAVCIGVSIYGIRDEPEVVDEHGMG